MRNNNLDIKSKHKNLNMRIHETIFFLAIALIIAGCVTNPQQPAATDQVITITEPESRSIPYRSGWRLGKESLLSIEEGSLGILGIEFTNSDTKIFIALSGVELARLIDDNSIELVDNLGRVYHLIMAVPLGNVEKFELGMLNFEPRTIGVTELNMTVTSKSEVDVTQKVLVAQFVTPASEDRLDTTFWMPTEYGVNLSGYNIGMTWLAAIEKPAASISKQPATLATSNTPATPKIPTREPWTETKNGGEVLIELTFIVENNTTKQANYVSAQLMSGGDVITYRNQTVEVPTPIILEAPKTVPTPYP